MKTLSNFGKHTATLLCVLILLSALSSCGSQALADGEESFSASSLESSSQLPLDVSSGSGAGRSTETVAEISLDAEDSSEEAVHTITVQIKNLTYAFEDMIYGHALKTYSAGELIQVTDIGNTLWYSAELEDGTTAYLYSEELYPVLEDGSLSAESLAQIQIQSKIDYLRGRLPEGKYWNHMGQEIPWGQETPFIITDTPCYHWDYGELYCNQYNGKTLELFSDYGYLCQCLGFASLLSDQIFGTEATPYFFYDYDQLRIGDQIRLNEYEHSMVVISKTDESVIVAEANEDYEDCLISWTREVTRYELENELSWDLEYISRYPLYHTEDGLIPIDGVFVIY